MSDNAKYHKIIARCEIDSKKILFWKRFETWKDIALMVSSFWECTIPIHWFGVLRNLSLPSYPYYGGEFEFDDYYLTKNELKAYSSVVTGFEYDNKQYGLSRRSANLIFHLACFINSLFSHIFPTDIFSNLYRTILICWALFQVADKRYHNYYNCRNQTLKEYCLSRISETRS